jgi:CDP-2,3-bis-(O-geranylgeranyl)-sn-glycerol synthase
MLLHDRLGTHDALDPLACALFLILAFVLAGVAHAAWLGSPASRRFAIPLDAGWTWRGKRILGANKTLRGFMVMIPATAGSFALLAWLASAHPALGSRLWPLEPRAYALLGLAAGAGFMVGELPNSFLKRRLGIEPGSAAATPLAKAFFSAVDRVDSIVGMLLAVSLLVPTPWLTWLYLVLLGPGIHLGFSFLLFRSGVKQRAA